MLPRAVLDGIVAGDIDLAFRRWSRRMHVPGGTQRTAVGVIRFDEVDVVEADTLTDDDAHRAGMSLDRLRDVLDRKPGDVYRIRLSWAGADERVTLREKARITPRERERLVVELAGMDERSRRGPWTREHLELIAERPGELAETIAASIGREKLPFKADIRRLKELGLTVSLRPGYRLSPRGEALLRHLRSLDGPTGPTAPSSPAQ